MTTTRITTESGEQIEVENGLAADGLDPTTGVMTVVDTEDMGRVRVAAVLTAEERRALAAALDPGRLSPEAVAEIERWAKDRRTARDEARRTAGDIAAGSRSCGWLSAGGSTCGALGARWTATPAVFAPRTVAVAVCEDHAKTVRTFGGWRVEEHRGPVPPDGLGDEPHPEGQAGLVRPLVTDAHRALAREHILRHMGDHHDEVAALDWRHEGRRPDHHHNVAGDDATPGDDLTIAEVPGAAPYLSAACATCGDPVVADIPDAWSQAARRHAVYTLDGDRG